MEKLSHFNEQPGFEGELTVEFDIATGTTKSCGSGFWSPRQARAFFQDWRDVVQRIHAAGQSVFAFVDLDHSNVQPAEVVEIIAKDADGYYQAGDAVAMVVPNSLTKMQMRRVLDPLYHNFFVSRNAAETWLVGRRLVVGSPFLKFVAH